MNQAKNRQELLSWIDTVSFCAYDMALYLDTHPEDENALAYYQKYKKLRKQALDSYAEQYGPLTMDHENTQSHWSWVTQPWPWEGGRR